MQDSITPIKVMAARRVIAPLLQPTPLRNYPSFDRLLGAQVYFKHENLNLTGTFKIRGGLNLMHHLAAEGTKGVITYSTGNHGTSVATSARIMGIPAMVVVPQGSNPLKMRAIRDAGAELIEHGANFEAAGRKVEELVSERGLFFVHPANEPRIIHGVGTGFLEIMEEAPDLDYLLVPLGAGSEVAAALTVFKALSPQTQVIAVQAAEAPAAHDSWKAGRIVTAPNTTMAGGVATGTAYELPFSIYSELLDDFVLVTEDEMYESIALMAHHTRTLCEAAGASTLAAALKTRDRLSGKKVGLQVSGSNASPQELGRAMVLSCLSDGRPLKL